MDARAFNLLSYVQKPVRLNAQRIALIIIICICLLVVIYYLSTEKLHHALVQTQQVKQQLKLKEQQVQQLIGPDRQLAAIFPLPTELDTQGFYQEFVVLRQMDIPGLWLTKLVIDREQQLIQLTGNMTSTDKLNQLLQFLAHTAPFDNYQFSGIDVTELRLPNIPKALRKDVDKLNIPTLYQFKVQTRPINSIDRRGS